ncbi:MAG: 50S ribosomal protein L15 [Cytophagales bacterium]|nr:50S ribosomal protein L15 [Cytophagales bacterium]
MELHNLRFAPGSVKKSKRLARGQGSGRGGTSTRGHKGAQSRSGYKRRFGFEGGQQPLQRRIPRFGFTISSRVRERGIDLDVIQSLVERKGLTHVDPKIFVENGLAHKKDKIKILGRGEIKTKITLAAHAFSSSAREKLEKSSSKVEEIS